jgi:hypothetical protein
MTDKEYLDLMIDERISMILNKNSDGREIEMKDAASKVIEDMDEKMRTQVEMCISLLIDTMAKSEVKLYVGGVRDGIKIAKWVNSI